MKAMFKPILFAAGFAVAALPVLMAEDGTTTTTTTTTTTSKKGNRPPRGPMDPAAQVARLKETLNLTQDQCDKILAVLKDVEPQMKALFDDTTLSREDKRAKMDAIRKATDAKIRAVLTEEQQKKFDSLPKGPRPPGGPQGGSGDNPPPPPEGAPEGAPQN